MTTDARIEAERVCPMIQVGSKLIEVERINSLNTGDVLNLARMARRKAISEKGMQRIRDLCPELIPSEKKQTSLSGTPVLNIIKELIRIRKFPPEIIVEANYILGLGMFASFTVD